jgi:hypothetical protein
MQATVTVTPAQLPELLLHVAVVRPVFLWGAPGIGKSSLVREFADSLGLECVTLLGTQLAPEDLIGVPELVNGRSRFAPPESIARDEPYCLFLDELNASAPEVQKAFYSLILDRRIGAYELPAGSVVIGAGNRATDNALARPMASALINRLVRAPPKTEEPFSSPRAWHMLSDVLTSYGDGVADETIAMLAFGTLTTDHASGFRAYVKTVRHAYDLNAVLKGEAPWPRGPEERDLLYFLAEAFRARLVKELPRDKRGASSRGRDLGFRAKTLLVELAEISLECAQLVIANDANGAPVLPTWFLVEIGRDVPRLMAARS